MQMKKHFCCLLAIWMVLAGLCGCGAGEPVVGEGVASEMKTENRASENQASEWEASDEQSPEVSDQESVIFTDDLGREVTVESHERVATLIGSFTDIWMLAGGEVVATANDSWESLNLDLGEDVVNLGSIQNPDAEKLIAAQPDLVLASANTDGDLALEELLEQAGITVAYFSVSDFSEYLHMLDICTDITGKKDLYEENGLAELGCINIADSDKGLLEDLSMEEIIAADPQYIFVTTQGNDYEAAMKNVEELFISNPAWASLSAVQNGNYYVLEKRLFNLKPNARWGEAYKILADILYPER